MPLQPGNPFDSSSTLEDPVENVVEDERKRRELPPWVFKIAPQWGERVCVPEWDKDEFLDGEVRADACDAFGVMDRMEYGYRSKNGWKVRVC